MPFTLKCMQHPYCEWSAQYIKVNQPHRDLWFTCCVELCTAIINLNSHDNQVQIVSCGLCLVRRTNHSSQSFSQIKCIMASYSLTGCLMKHVTPDVRCFQNYLNTEIKTSHFRDPFETHRNIITTCLNASYLVWFSLWYCASLHSEFWYMIWSIVELVLFSLWETLFIDIKYVFYADDNSYTSLNLIILLILYQIKYWVYSKVYAAQ